MNLLISFLYYHHYLPSSHNPSKVQWLTSSTNFTTCPYCMDGGREDLVQQSDSQLDSTTNCGILGTAGPFESLQPYYRYCTGLHT